jgi:hypothetical protein
MKVSVRLIRSLLASITMLLASVHAHAFGDWENGKVLHDANGCGTDCHARKDGASAALITSAIANQMPMNDLFAPGKPQALSPSQISDIAAYLNNLNFPKISVSTFVDLGTRVAKTTTNSVLLKVTNNGFGDLSLTGASVADTFNFSVSPTTCTITSVPPNNFCNLTVGFMPQVAGNPLTTTLTLTHDALGGSTAVTLSGISLLPLELTGPPSVQFNSGDAAKPVRVVENIAHDVRVCKSGGSSFPSPGDFAVSGVPLDPVTGCGTFGIPAAVPKNLDVSVTFLAAAGSGPKNAVLTYQRVVGGVDVGDPVAVQLQGNLGPVIHFDDTDPFNHGPTDQTEVDGSAFTERVIKISNAGNGPLNFTSFAIASADPAQPGSRANTRSSGPGVRSSPSCRRPTRRAR